MCMFCIHRHTLHSASAFFSNIPQASTKCSITASKTTCYAKLNKIASNFDLDEILSNEKEFNKVNDKKEATFASGPSRKKGQKRNAKKDLKKKMLKEQMKQQKLEKQQTKKDQKSSSGAAYEADFITTDDDTADINYEQLFQSIDFDTYEVPSSLNGGKRIDAVLVDLLNKENTDSSDNQSANPISISRSQCGTLLSNECVFVIPPENTTSFSTALQAYKDEQSASDGDGVTVPYSLLNEYGSSIQRKSHILESTSMLAFPTRDSLLSASSSALLSNFIPPTEIIAQNIPLDVLYEDEHMIVLNKQAGMVVHPAAGNWDGTIVNALAYYLMNDSPFGAGEFFTNEDDDGDEADVNQNDAVTNSISTLRPGIVHRLDKGTTGCMVVAKTSSALATLSEAFADRKVKKQYLAVAIGNPGEDQWINKPIGRHPLHRQKMRVVPDPSSSVSRGGQARLTGARGSVSLATAKQGRTALSHIHTIHYDGKLSVVQVRIATGRTHQIRVHMQDHGTPIYGDDVYGLNDWNKALSSRRGITRPLLHAQMLEIDHPVTGETMTFEADVADDMMGVIKTTWPAGEEIVF